MTTLSCTLHGALDLRLTPTEPRALGPHDVRLRLERGADGSYRAALPPLPAGRWRAVVDDPRGEWRVVQEDLPAAKGVL